MVSLIVIMSIGFIIFFTRYLLLKSQVKSLVQQLQERKKQRVHLSLNNRLIESLALEMNHLIDQQKEEKANKLRVDRELKQAIAGMSHDLRTPLTAIIGYLELIENQNLPEEEQKHYLMIAKKRAKHLQQLINNFFALSTVDTEDYPLQLEKVHLNLMVKEILMNYYDRFEAEDKQPIIQLPNDPVIIISDQNALKRVLENLLLNALQHAAGNIVIDLYVKGNQAIFSIKNTINEKQELDSDQIFERFYTTDQARQYHRGLGLSIVKNLMGEMNGELFVRIEDGEFHISCFWPKTVKN